MPPYLPGGLEDFVTQVVPILQRRGLFRTEYRGQHVARPLWAAPSGEPVRAGRPARHRNERVTSGAALRPFITTVFIPSAIFGIGQGARDTGDRPAGAANSAPPSVSPG